VKLALLALVAAFLTAGAAAPASPRFVGTISRVGAADLPRSYRPGCPVSPSQLRLLRVSHWDFRGRVHVGELVVQAREAQNVVSVFRRLYAARFPIRRLRLVDVYGADDDRSMAADNTSGFNCRRAEGSSSWSAHAYGLAIDVNPVENPFILNGRVSPPASRRYLDRSRVRRGMAIRGNVLVRAFASIGWSWGGRWTNPLDYQHFSATGG
jgi:D-alanyl-D-alanine carboxypeptidase-like protein